MENLEREFRETIEKKDREIEAKSRQSKVLEENLKALEAEMNRRTD